MTASQKAAALDALKQARMKLEQYFSDQAVEFASQPLTSDESQILSPLVGRFRRKKQCYANAQRIVLECDMPNVQYAEGYVAHHIEHAWVVINGKVIDPTLRHMGAPVMGTFDNRTYRGVLFAAIEVAKTVASTDRYGPLLPFAARGELVCSRIEP